VNQLNSIEHLKTPLFDSDRVSKLLDGAIDIHIHSGPDPYLAGVQDELEISIQACQAGMQAIVHKCHSSPTVRSSITVQKIVNQWADEHQKKATDIFGGIVLNYEVGGLNPDAVAANILLGGKFVWTPTKDASHHRKVTGKEGGIQVLDENDNILHSLREIFSLIAESDKVLSLCHHNAKERIIMLDEAKKAGVKRIEVCHPHVNATKMTIEQMKIAVDKGAYLGMYCLNFGPINWSWDLFMQAVTELGCDNIIASTDSHYQFATPIELFRIFISGMIHRGISDRDIEKMVKINASNLIY